MMQKNYTLSRIFLKLKATFNKCDNQYDRKLKSRIAIFELHKRTSVVKSNACSSATMPFQQILICRSENVNVMISIEYWIKNGSIIFKRIDEWHVDESLDDFNQSNLLNPVVSLSC